MRRRIGLALACVLFWATGANARQTTSDPTARPVWRTTQATVGTPVIAGDHVFALTADHQLVKVALADGSETWRVSTGEVGVTYGHALAVTSASVLAGEYDIVGIDRATGRRRWTFSPPVGYAPGPYLGDVDRDEVVFAGSASGHLYAVDVRSGLLIWTTVVDQNLQSTIYSPRVDGSVVIAGFTQHAAPSGGGLVAVSVADGRERWRFRFPTRAVSTHLAGGPVIVGGLIVAASGDGQIWAVDREPGARRWTLPPNMGELDSIVRAGDQDHRSLAVSGSILVAGSTTGYVLGYDVDQQREAWRYAGGRLGSTAFAMAARDGIVFVPYVSGFLVALTAATGQQQWRTHDWQQGFVWPPAVTGRIAVVCSRQGMWALRIDSEDQP